MPSNAVIGVARADRRADRAVRLVERRHGERELERVVAAHAGERRAPASTPRLRRRAALRALPRRRRRRSRAWPMLALAGERVRDRELGARLARDPLVGVQAGERAARADVDEARRAVELRARVGEVELLRNGRAPVSRKSAPNETMSFASLKLERGHATPYAARFAAIAAASASKSTLRCGAHAEPASHASRKRGKAAGLVLVEEHGVALPRATRRSFWPRRVMPSSHVIGFQLPLVAHHRRAEAIGIVEPLQRRLAARAERAAVQRVLRISLELDRAAVARLGDDAARGRALAAGRRVVGRDAGNRLVGRYEIRNELSRRLPSSAAAAMAARRHAEDLEERRGA